MKARTVQLGEVCDFIRGVTFASGEGIDSPAENSVACLTTSGVQNEVAWKSRRFIPANRISNDRQFLRAGDILISTANSKELVGKSCIADYVPFKCTFGAFVAVARPKEQILPRYLAYWMSSAPFLAWSYKYSSNTTNISNLRVSELEEMDLELPDLSEQHRIAGELERADGLRRARRYALELADTFLPAAFLHLFGDWQAAVGKYPVKILEEVVQPDRGVTYGIVQAGPHIPNGVPYIRTGDIVGGVIRTEKLLRTSREIADSYRRSEVKIGDIVISIRATVGTVAVLPPELDGANLTQGTGRIAPGPEIKRNFLLWQIRMQDTQRWIMRQVKGTTFFEITLAKLRELPVFVPPLPLQTRFAELVERHERLRSVQRESLRQADHLFQSLLHRAFNPN